MFVCRKGTGELVVDAARTRDTGDREYYGRAQVSRRREAERDGMTADLFLH
jgi:hypothetical protein